MTASSDIPKGRLASILRGLLWHLSTLPEGRDMGADELRNRVAFNLTPAPTEEEMEAATKKALDKGWIDYRHDDLEDRDRYFITDRGRENVPETSS